MMVASLYQSLIRENQPEVLSKIHESGLNAVIWDRCFTIDPCLLKVLGEVESDFTYQGDIEGYREALKAHFDLDGSMEVICEDFLELSSLFSQITNEKDFRWWMGWVKNGMCRRFHADLNELRMLCTYVGRGTEILPDDAVDREQLHSRGENEHIVRDKNRIQCAGPGDVVVLKGALYQGENVYAAVHKSPAASPESPRFVFRIDTNTFQLYNK